MPDTIEKTLKNEKIHGLTLPPPLVFKPDAPIGEVIQKMAERRIGSALVEEGGKCVGIFTERDLLTRVVEPKADPKTPIEKLMTRDPKVLKIVDSVAQAIRLMSRGGYRHVPLVDEGGRIQGVLSARTVVKYLAEHFPSEIYNLPPDPHQVQRAREGA